MTRKVPCEVYSRIVGYFRPVQNWNEGKKQEFEDRKVFRPASQDGSGVRETVGAPASPPEGPTRS